MSSVGGAEYEMLKVLQDNRPQTNSRDRQEYQDSVGD